MKRAYQTGFLIFSLILFIYSACIGIKNVFRYNGFRLENLKLKQTVQDKRIANRHFKHELTQMASDTYWEVQAKQRLGYIKKGETIINFYD